MRLVSKITGAIKNFFYPPFEVDVLPSVDYKIHSVDPLLADEAWMVFYKDKLAAVFPFFVKERAVRFCWEHWNELNSMPRYQEKEAIDV